RYLRQDNETLQEILLISDDAPSGAPLDPYKFMVHKPRSKSGSVWRNGLARLVAVMYMLKSFTVRDWWAFAEVFGIPVRVGKYGPNASTEDISTLVNAIGRIASDAGAVIPESMKLELIETAKGNGGNTLFENMARWCDEQTSKAVLGQTMTADNGSSQSQANVHNDVRMDIAEWDARQLQSCINEYLVKPYIILNWGPQEHYPKVRIQLPQPEDLKMLVDSITPLIDRGFKVSASSVREKFGLPEPDE
ncbi:phage portal protein family protein, partial [Vibrio europaeus]